MKKDIPVAKPGDQMTFKVAPRPVLAVSMMEQHDEIQVMGLVPNMADGARVAIGAGLRRRGLPPLANPQLVHVAALDPAQAVETAANMVQLARQAATLRGQTIAPEPSDALKDMVVFLAGSLPVESTMDIADRIMDLVRAAAEGQKPRKLN